MSVSGTKIASVAARAVLLLIYTALLLEIFAFIGTKAGLFLFNDTPRYTTRFLATSPFSQSIGYAWRTEGEPWGAWHRKNSSSRHKSSCFDVEYRSNNVGARDDVQYDINGMRNSVLLLGDSFLEGFGLHLEQTFAKQLEHRIKRQTLNFGAAGSVGPVQYYVLYEKLAKQFNHSDLVVLFLPSNDFSDNDWQVWKVREVDRTRYRPYFRRLGDGKYDFVYPATAVKHPYFGAHYAQSSNWRAYLMAYTYFSNVYRTVEEVFYAIATPSRILEDPVANSYYFQNVEAIDGALHFLFKVFENEPAGNGKFVVVIPRESDIKRFLKGESYKDLYWVVRLHDLARERGVVVVDLMNYISQLDLNGMFNCDGHWSPAGAEWAARILAAEMRSRQ